MLRDLLPAITGSSPESLPAAVVHRAFEIATLPIPFGGCGLRSALTVSPAAFVSSFSASQRLFREYNDALGALFTWPSPSQGQLPVISSLPLLRQTYMDSFGKSHQAVPNGPEMHSQIPIIQEVWRCCTWVESLAKLAEKQVQAKDTAMKTWGNQVRSYWQSTYPDLKKLISNLDYSSPAPIRPWQSGNYSNIQQKDATIPIAMLQRSLLWDSFRQSEATAKKCFQRQLQFVEHHGQLSGGFLYALDGPDQSYSLSAPLFRYALTNRLFLPMASETAPGFECPTCTTAFSEASDMLAHLRASARCAGTNRHHNLNKAMQLGFQRAGVRFLREGDRGVHNRLEISRDPAKRADALIPRLGTDGRDIILDFSGVDLYAQCHSLANPMWAVSHRVRTAFAEESPRDFDWDSLPPADVFLSLTLEARSLLKHHQNAALCNGRGCEFLAPVFSTGGAVSSDFATVLRILTRAGSLPFLAPWLCRTPVAACVTRVAISLLRDSLGLLQTAAARALPAGSFPPEFSTLSQVFIE